jgi:predicted metal-dependent hydrolase
MSHQEIINYGKEPLAFNILYVVRKTIEIAVYPDTSVIVKAPFNTDLEEIKKRVLKHAGWIKKQIISFMQFAPRTPQRNYVGGETHLYLGKQYRLKIKANTHDEIKLKNGYFWIYTKNPTSPIKIKNLLTNWYMNKAKIKFRQSLEKHWLVFKKFAISKPELYVRLMKTRWGSLSQNGKLILNRDLIRAPLECIDYVVIHELCHLIHCHHSTSFYRLMEKILPDWKKQKYKLEQTLA